MKKNIYKVLGVVLAMAIVLSACFCAMTIASADVTEGDIIYPAFSQGNIYEKDGAVQIQPENVGRVYTETMYKVAEIEKVVVAAPYQANFILYDAQGNYVGNTGYQPVSEVKPSVIGKVAAQFRIVLKDTTNNDVCTATELASDVVALYKAAQDVTVDGVTTPVMMQANIISSQGGRVQTDSTNRIATKSQFEVSKYEKIVLADGFRMVVHFWKADGTYIGETGWQTGTKTVSALPNAASATYFRVVAGDNANSDPFAPADFPEGTLTLVQFPEDYVPPVTEDVIEDGILYPYLAPGTVNGAPLASCVAAHATRLYTVTTFEVADIDEMIVAADCRAFVQFFNEDGSYNNGNGWFNPGTHKIGTLEPAKNGAKYFKVTFSSTKGGNDTVTPPTDGLSFKLTVEIPEDVIVDGVLTPTLVSGTINGAPFKVDTCLTAHATRLATYYTYEIADFDRIIIEDGIEIFVQFFMEDGSYTAVGAGSGWIDKAGSYKISGLNGAEGAKYFRVTYDSHPRGSVPTPGLMTFTLAPEEVPCEHTYDNDCDKDCNLCGELREVADHVYENYTFNNDATCTKNGTETGTCACGATDTREVADSKLDHSYENYTSNGDATCTADGTKTGTCACGATDTIADEGSMLDHTYESYVSNNDATCTANGTETATCACGATNTREVADSKLDHTYVDYTSNNDATCTADGTKTGTCVCGATDTIADVGSMLDHTYVDYTSNGDATCTADGTKTGTCVCGATDTIADVGSMLDHTYVDYTSNGDATCTADGTKTGTCVCGATDTIVDEGSAVDHAYADENEVWCEYGCGHWREIEVDDDEVALVEDNGVKVIYMNGLTAVEGLYEVDGKYYAATWGGKVLTNGTYFISNTYCDVAAGRDFTVDENGFVLDGIVETADGKVLYDMGITAMPGLYEIDGNLYVVTWGGKVETNGTYYAVDTFCDVAAGRDFAVDAEGVVLNGLVEIEGKLYVYENGITVAPGEYEFDGVIYNVTWGGLVVAE